MSGWYLWFAILGLTFATLLTRSGLHLAGRRVQIPPRLEAALRFAPACALAAIIAPDLAYADGTLALSWNNPRLIGGMAAVAIFVLTRSMIATVGGGMAVFWLARAWFGG
jgi:branched-subunit amino acid transport protein